MGAVVAGLLLISVAYVAMFASLAVRGVPRLLLGFTAFALGSIAALAFIALLAFDRSDPFACPIPGRDSELAESHWTWFPPGNVCDYETGDVGPTYWRVPAGLAIVAMPGVWVTAWALRRRDDWEALMMESVAE